MYIYILPPTNCIAYKSHICTYLYAIHITPQYVTYSDWPPAGPAPLRTNSLRARSRPHRPSPRILLLCAGLFY